MKKNHIPIYLNVGFVMNNLMNRILGVGSSIRNGEMEMHRKRGKPEIQL